MLNLNAKQFCFFHSKEIQTCLFTKQNCCHCHFNGNVYELNMAHGIQERNEPQKDELNSIMI